MNITTMAELGRSLTKFSVHEPCDACNHISYYDLDRERLLQLCKSVRRLVKKLTSNRESRITARGYWSTASMEITRVFGERSQGLEWFFGDPWVAVLLT